MYHSAYLFLNSDGGLHLSVLPHQPEASTDDDVQAGCWLILPAPPAYMITGLLQPQFNTCGKSNRSPRHCLQMTPSTLHIIVSACHMQLEAPGLNLSAGCAGKVHAAPPVSCVACIEPDPVEPQAEEPADHWAHGLASRQQQLKEQSVAPGLQSMQDLSERQLCKPSSMQPEDLHIIRSEQNLRG